MTTLKTAVRRTPRAAPLRRSVRWGAIAALAAISLQAHATGYTRIVAGGLPFESLSGAPLQYAASDSAASASAMGVTSSASNVGNWVGGPYVTGQSELGFGIAGAAGTFSTVTLQVSIVADTTMGSAFDHNTNVSFGAVLSGNASTFNSAAWGSAVSIYCGGCGGLIEVGTINLDTDADGTVQSTGWSGQQAFTVTLSTRIENGIADAGHLSLGVEGNANSGLTFASVTVLGVSDGLGQVYSLPSGGGFLAPVPEPGSWAMLVAGGLLLAARRRPAGR